MARKKDLCRTANGLFVRNLGWKRTATGYAQQKFYLGRDEAQAQLASLRLEQLWEQACRRWAREREGRPQAGAVPPRPAPAQTVSIWPGQAGLTQIRSTISIGPDQLPPLEDVSDRPVWDDVTLAIAEAVRTGETVVRIPLPLPFSAMRPDSALLGEWINQLQSDITVIKIELPDDEARAESQQYAEREGRRLIDMGRKMLHREAGGEVLHSALEAYSRWIGQKYVTPEQKPTPWGSAQVRQVAFLRRHLPDCALGEMDSQRVEELIDILRLRPAGDGGQPISASWARNCIKQFRHFLRWLNKAKEFGWRRPADLELGQVRIPLTPREMSAPLRSSQVQTYTSAELRTCWEYAEPFQRLLMLLALNCGFGRAELASLELDDLLLRQRHPQEDERGCVGTPEDGWIRRVRHKTRVYGEWRLWPETILALEWWLRQRASVGVAPGVTTVLVTRNGQRYDRPTKGNHANLQISNSWQRLAERVRKDQPEFRGLSFNKLRKTAGNLIRSEAGGEVAGVFLAHGTPVKADELLDVYTNRPFVKVFEALDRVGEKLRPLWEHVPVPFPEVRKLGGPNISKGTIRRIQALRRQGYKLSYIAEKLGVAVETARRWGNKAD